MLTMCRCRQVMLVRWNEPYQKLATCDVTGIIFVWIKHDGRWSIELINDRSSQVTDHTLLIVLQMVWVRQFPRSFLPPLQ